MSQAFTRMSSLATKALRQRQQDPAAFFRACRAGPSTSSPPRTRGRLACFPSAAAGPRQFSTTLPRPATVILQNPRVDDDGKDMTIEISERAAKRLKQLTSEPPKKNTLVASPSSQDAHLRVTVTSGGCHGFQYLMSLEDASKVDQEEDTVFAADDPQSGSGKAEVVMDTASLELLKGSTIDFTTELIGSSFKIVGNPRATSSCGCGTSFDIE